MARTLNITAPSDKTDALVADLRELKQVLDLKLLRNASVSPPGDMIIVAVPNRSLNELMCLLDAHGLGERGGLSLTSSEVASYIPAGMPSRIERDNNEATWEEMEMTVADDSNSSVNTLVTMFIAGILAAIGVATNNIHVAIAGMLVAPGFMPMVRVSLGFVGRRPLWHYGLEDFLKGYAALIIGAALTALVMGLAGDNATSGYYQVDKSLMNYWTGITLPSASASAAAALAGALLVASKRSVFTSGVMIGLALVPSAAIIGMALVTFDFAVASKALIRFLLDGFLVLVISAVVLAVDKHYVHRRNIRL